MTLEIGLVLCILLVATVLFVTNFVGFDLVAVGIVVSLVLTGLVEPADALAGLSNEATVAIAAMLVLSEGLRRTGVLDRLRAAVAALGDQQPWRAKAALLGGAGLASGFMNNTAVVAILIPVVMDLGRDLKTSPSRLLMPLSFVCILGGLCTLVGTSTNLLVSSIAVEQGLDPLSMFELAPAGVVLLAVGAIYVTTVAPRWLPEREADQALTRRYELGAYLTDVEVGEHLVHDGSDDGLTEGLDLDVLEVHRDGHPLAASDNVAPGDVMRIRGSASEIGRLLARDDLRMHSSDALDDVDMSAGDLRLVEVVIPPETALVGTEIGQAGLRDRFGADVLAVRQGRQLRRSSLASVRLSAGDALLLITPRGREAELDRTPSLVVVSRHRLPDRRSWRGALAVGILAAVVVSATVTSVPIAITALCGCVAMVLAGCIRAEEAYEAINWKVILLLAGVVPLGTALETTGAADLVVSGALSLLGDLGPRGLLFGILFLTMLLTNLLTNVAAAAFLAPVAIEVAAGLQADPRPFLVAVAFGASLSFLSPIGHQTNTLIVGPGQYRYADFLRVGAPLTVVCLVLSTVMIPWVWPL